MTYSFLSVTNLLDKKRYIESDLFSMRDMIDIITHTDYYILSRILRHYFYNHFITNAVNDEGTISYDDEVIKISELLLNEDKKASELFSRLYEASKVFTHEFENVTSLVTYIVKSRYQDLEKEEYIRMNELVSELDYIKNKEGKRYIYIDHLKEKTINYVSALESNRLFDEKQKEIKNLSGNLGGVLKQTFGMNNNNNNNNKFDIFKIVDKFYDDSTTMDKEKEGEENAN